MFYSPKSQPWPNDPTNPIFIKIPAIYLSYWKVLGESNGITIWNIFNKFERAVPTLVSKSLLTERAEHMKVKTI